MAAIIISKLMSISRTEFIRSFEKFAPDYNGDLSVDKFDLSYEKGTVLIEIQVLPKRTLGGLLALPQSNITITLKNLTEAEQKSFLARFDQSFQRGGG